MFTDDISSEDDFMDPHILNLMKKIEKKKQKKKRKNVLNIKGYTSVLTDQR